MYKCVNIQSCYNNYTYIHYHYSCVNDFLPCIKKDYVKKIAYKQARKLTKFFVF